MLLILHIIVALAGLVAATIAYFTPNKAKLDLTYGLLAGTIITGTYLVVMSPSHLVMACTSGLVYTAVVLVLSHSARRKLLDV